MRNIFFIVLLIMTSATFAQQTPAKVTNADAATFKSLIERKDGIVIDLRTPDETKKGIIKGAVEMDYLAKDFEAQVNKLDKKKKYYVYCQGGGRSADAADYMVKHGFTYVVNLEKGYGSWVKQGYETEIKK